MLLPILIWILFHFIRPLATLLLPQMRRYISKFPRNRHLNAILLLLLLLLLPSFVVPRQMQEEGSRLIKDFDRDLVSKLVGSSWEKNSLFAIDATKTNGESRSSRRWDVSDSRAIHYNFFICLNCLFPCRVDSRSNGSASNKNLILTTFLYIP